MKFLGCVFERFLGEVLDWPFLRSFCLVDISCFNYRSLFQVVLPGRSLASLRKHLNRWVSPQTFFQLHHNGFFQNPIHRHSKLEIRKTHPSDRFSKYTVWHITPLLYERGRCSSFRTKRWSGVNAWRRLNSLVTFLKSQFSIFVFPGLNFQFFSATWDSRKMTLKGVKLANWSRAAQNVCRCFSALKNCTSDKPFLTAGSTCGTDGLSRVHGWACGKPHVLIKVSTV